MNPLILYVFVLDICATMGYDQLLWSRTQRNNEACPLHCRCLKMSSTAFGMSYSKSSQFIEQSNIHINSILEDDEIDNRSSEMVCLGLRNIPSALPRGLGRLTIFGDSSGLRQDQSDNSISTDGETNNWIVRTQLTELKSESFKESRELKELTISGNNMNILYPNAFRGLNKLQSLMLQTNNIRHLSSSAFYGLHQLQELSLSDNLIGSLPSRVFVPLINLKKLHMNGNKIMILYKDVFRSLTRLEYLDLSRNNFSDLYDDIFDFSTSLKELILNGNILWTIKRRWFQNLISLKKLSMNGNSLTRLPPLAFVHLSNLHFLYLSANHIFHIDETAFQNLTHLRELDLGTNDLSYISSASFEPLQQLMDLLLRANNLNIVRRGNFYFLSNLLNLDISQNAIREIEPYSFRALRNLKILDISYNKVRSIKRWTFSGLVQLKELNLNHNFISKLEEYSFATAAMSHFSKLTWLKLQYNKLKTVSAYTFAGLPQLKWLNVGHNKISNINKRSFTSLASLQTVSINNNRLTRLENGIFINQGDVRNLNIAGNRLTDIEPTVLVGLDHLENLDIHSNSLMHIPSELFRGSPNLIQVNLKQNKIKSFDFDSVSLLGHLIHLDLSENNISWVNVPENLNMRLKHLSLASNALQTIGSGIIRSIQPRGILSVFKNPFVCDCDFKWLVEALSSDHVRLEQSSRAKCSSPPDLAGTLIAKLTKKDFRCTQSTIVNSTDSIICDSIPFRTSNGNKTRDIKEEAISRHVTLMGKTRLPILNGILLNSDWALTSENFLSSLFYNLSLSDIQVRAGHKERSRVMAYVHNSFRQEGIKGYGIVLLRLHSKYPAKKLVRKMPCFVSNIQLNTYSQSNNQVLLTARIDGSKPRSKLRSRRGELLDNCTDDTILCVKVRDSDVLTKRSKFFIDGAPLFLSQGKNSHLVGMGHHENGSNKTDKRYVPLWDAAKWIDYVIKEIDKNCMVQWMNGELLLKCKDVQSSRALGLLQEIH